MDTERHTTSSIPDKPKRVGIIGAFFLVILLVFLVGAALNNPNLAPAAGAEEGEKEPLARVLLPTVTETETAVATSTSTNTPSPTQTTAPTFTPANTATATQTNTPTATFTSTPTETPTLTPLPPTATSLPTATPTITLPTPDPVYSWTLKVPVLMYHYISVPPEDADNYRTDLSVTPDNFHAQMRYLAENGYTPIDFYDLSLAIASKIELPDKPVILTFDDGYLDNYQNAFPILKEFGFTGTFFIVTEFVDKGYAGYMNWEIIREMSAAGMRMEPHSRTHLDLRERDRGVLIWEMLGPQETLAAHIGYTPRYFSYPSGRYDEDTIQMAYEIGYWGAVTTRGGKWHGFNDRYEWTRLRVRNDTPLAEFIDLVDPGDTVGGKFTN